LVTQIKNVVQKALFSFTLEQYQTERRPNSAFISCRGFVEVTGQKTAEYEQAAVEAKCCGSK